MDLHWTDHLLFLLVGVIIPLRTVLGTQPQLKLIQFDTRLKLQLYWGNNLWLWLLTGGVALVWWWNDRSWADLGLTWPPEMPQGLPLWVLAFFVGLYLADTFLEINNQAQLDEAREQMKRDLGFLPQTAYEYLHYISLALTAGFCEEFIFRGYFIRYFQLLLGEGESTFTLAILIPAVIFAVVHFYQGWQAVVKIGGMAVMFGFIFVHTGSLWLLMIIHAGVDLLGGAIAWQLLAKHSEPPASPD